MVSVEEAQKSLVSLVFKADSELLGSDNGCCLQLPEEQQARLIVGLRKVDVPILATPVAHG